MIVGIDPGKTGAVCFLDMEGFPIVRALPQDPHELAELLSSEVDEDRDRVLVEKVSAGGVANSQGRRMGATSAFTFGRGFGSILGVLAALKIPHDLVTPQKWTAVMGLKGKTKKDHTAVARRLYPQVLVTRNRKEIKASITEYVADSVLIAEYGRRFVWPSPPAPEQGP